MLKKLAQDSSGGIVGKESAILPSYFRYTMLFNNESFARTATINATLTRHTCIQEPTELES